MKTLCRRGFSLFEMLVVLAILGFLVGMLLVAVSKARQAAKRIESVNNMAQIGLACHNYHDAFISFPAGNSKNNHSAHSELLSYIEHQQLVRHVQIGKPVDDPANAKVAKTFVKLYVSPMDPLPKVGEYGPTNYLFCAGSKPGLKDNDGVCYQESRVSLDMIANADGTAVTMMLSQTLRGDGGTKAVDVRRQHVTLKKDALAGLKPESGVQEWKDGKSIAGNRGGSWMDGRFLQTTFSATRAIDDPAPDVDCEGMGGLSAMRTLDVKVVPVLFCDRHVQNIPATFELKMWKALATWKGGERVDLP